MNKKFPKKILIETDVLINYLTEPDDNVEPDLIMLLQNSISFTTVLNASELFYAAKDEAEHDGLKKF